MSDKSKIEWTDATWNPVRGCTKISPGCAHCYAETFAERFRGVPGHPYEQGFDLRLVPEKLAEPLRWSRPRMIFVNSMSDLFHKDVPRRLHRAGRRGDADRNWHTYQVLPSVGAAGRDALQPISAIAAREPHIWWGVSVENRRHGSRASSTCGTPRRRSGSSPSSRSSKTSARSTSPGSHWVIVGGESGHGARPMKAEWVRSHPRPVSGMPASRSSSSNGAACERARPAGSSMAARMTRCRPAARTRSLQPVDAWNACRNSNHASLPFSDAGGGHAICGWPHRGRSMRGQDKQKLARGPQFIGVARRFEPALDQAASSDALTPQGGTRMRAGCL